MGPRRVGTHCQAVGGNKTTDLPHTATLKPARPARLLQGPSTGHWLLAPSSPHPVSAPPLYLGQSKMETWSPASTKMLGIWAADQEPVGSWGRVCVCVTDRGRERESTHTWGTSQSPNASSRARPGIPNSALFRTRGQRSGPERAASPYPHPLELPPRTSICVQRSPWPAPSCPL